MFMLMRADESLHCTTAESGSSIMFVDFHIDLSRDQYNERANANLRRIYKDNCDYVSSINL